MKAIQFTTAGGLALLSIVACSTAWNYRRFSPDFKSVKDLSVLRGVPLLSNQGEKDDRTMYDCVYFSKSGALQGSDCIVMFWPDFKAAKDAAEELERQNKVLKRKCGSKCSQ